MIRLLLLTLLIGFTTLHTSQAQSVLKTHTVTSPKYGITAWLVEDHTLPLFTLKFAFQGAGSAQDTHAKQGLAQLMSNTLDEGAGPYDATQFQKALRDNSITLHFGATPDAFTGTLKTLTRTQDKALSLLKLALTEPRFDTAPVNRMIAANVSRIRSNQIRPDWRAARLVKATAFENHPYALNSGGTISTLQALTPTDLKAFHARALSQDTLHIAVAGALSPQALAALLDDTFGALPKTGNLTPLKPLTRKGKGTTTLHPHDTPQTTIRLLYDGIAVTDPLYHAAHVVNFTFGGAGFGARLMERLREKEGLTYGIYSQLERSEAFDGLRISLSTDNASTAKALTLIQAERKAMLTSPITQAELDKAKTYLIGALPLSLTSTNAIASTLLSLQLKDLPQDYLDTRQSTLDALPLKDVHTAAKKLLSTQNAPTILLIGQPEAITPDRTLETLPNIE